MTKQKVCKCGRGAVSAYDGKCGHCRTKKERKRHQHLLMKSHTYITLPQEKNDD